MNWILITLASVLFTSSALATKPVMTCEPRVLRGVPGEPLQVTLTVETDRAAPMQLHIPSVSNLVLRTVEKIPIRRTPAGRYIQKRILIWQGLESGSTTITNLTVSFQGVEPTAGGRTEKCPESAAIDHFSERNITAIGSDSPLGKKCPSIGITIDEVVPATPPNNPPRPTATPPAEGNETTSIIHPLLWRGAGTAGWVLHFPEVAI